MNRSTNSTVAPCGMTEAEADGTSSGEPPPHFPGFPGRIAVVGAWALAIGGP